ncbi:MAG: 50S ribosomal protein L11 methyltransferase, partial [Verrucomicrobiota bacterium]
MGTKIVDFELGGITLKLKVGDDAFEPNLTTRLIADHAEIKEGSRVLDLGCGVGPLAIFAALKGAREVVAADVMESACSYTIENAELNGVSDR